MVPWPEPEENSGQGGNDVHSKGIGDPVPPPPPACGPCETDGGKGKKGHSTRFLTLDKVLPGRDFLQILTIPAPEAYVSTEKEEGQEGKKGTSNTEEEEKEEKEEKEEDEEGQYKDQQKEEKEEDEVLEICYDLEWLAIIKKTNPYLTTNRNYNRGGGGAGDNYSSVPSHMLPPSVEEVEAISLRLQAAQTARGGTGLGKSKSKSES